MRTTTTMIRSSASGSGISSSQDSSRLATLTNDPFPTCGPMTCADIPSVTSSPESADGVTRSGSQDGPKIDLFGREVARVLRIRQPPEGATSMPTYGRTFGISLRRARLLLYLESKLQARGLGWLASALTWKPLDIGSNTTTCRLTVSARIMRENGFILRATPTATANQAAKSMEKWPGCRGIEVSPEEWCRRMGYPAAWLAYAPSETQYIQKSLLRS